MHASAAVPWSAVGRPVRKNRETKEPSPAETKAVLGYAHGHGLLLIKSGMYDNVVRTLMPLNIPDEQLGRGLRILGDALGYVSELRNPSVPSYWSTDLRLAWRPNDRMEFAIVGQNLFDDQHPLPDHRDAAGSPLP